MLIHLPGQREQKKIKGSVSQIDLIPTILDMMNQEIPEHLEGKSLLDLMKKEGDATADKDVFIEWNGPNSALTSGDKVGAYEYIDSKPYNVSQQELIDAANASIRTVITPDGWKFNWSSRGEHELFNINNDSEENMNLAEEEQYQDLIASLLKKIRNWQAKTND